MIGFAGTRRCWHGEHKVTQHWSKRFVNMTRTLQRDVEAGKIEFWLEKSYWASRKLIYIEYWSLHSDSVLRSWEACIPPWRTITSLPSYTAWLETEVQTTDQTSYSPLPSSKGNDGMNTEQSGPFTGSQQFQFHQLSKALVEKRSRQIIAHRPNWAKFSHHVCLYGLQAKNGFYIFKW